MDYETPNYTLHSINLDNNIDRGIAVYSHASIDKSIIQINPDIIFDEDCLLEVRLWGGDNLLFGCCYRSPTKTISSGQNTQKLNQRIKCISEKKYSHKCIVGDFNY